MWNAVTGSPNLQIQVGVMSLHLREEQQMIWALAWRKLNTRSKHIGSCDDAGCLMFCSYFSNTNLANP
jgi:hypothetical protein